MCCGDSLWHTGRAATNQGEPVLNRRYRLLATLIAPFLLPAMLLADTVTVVTSFFQGNHHCV